MSITFHLATATADGTGLACTARHGSSCEVPEHLLDEYAHMIPGLCMDCREVEVDACAVCSLSLNVNNANAAAILERLGVEWDECGSFDPADLLGRAMLGNIGRDDSGVSSSEVSARWVECGVRPGYFEDRFGSLAVLASEALARGLVVSWG